MKYKCINRIGRYTPGNYYIITREENPNISGLGFYGINDKNQKTYIAHPYQEEEFYRWFRQVEVCYLTWGRLKSIFIKI